MSICQNEPGFTWMYGGLVPFCQTSADCWGADVPSWATWEQKALSRHPGSPGTWRPHLQSCTCNTAPEGVWNFEPPNPECLDSAQGCQALGTIPPLLAQVASYSWAAGCCLLCWIIKLTQSHLSNCLIQDFPSDGNSYTVICFVLILNKTFLNYQNGHRRVLSKLTPPLSLIFERTSSYLFVFSLVSLLVCCILIVCSSPLHSASDYHLN